MKGALALRNPTAAPIGNDCTVTTITVAAYVQLVAALGSPASAIAVQNTSAKAIKIAVGGAGAEVDKFIIAPGSVDPVILPIELKKGVRISAKAVTADATTGVLALNFLG